jgi:hypothetical protein
VDWIDASVAALQFQWSVRRLRTLGVLDCSHMWGLSAEPMALMLTGTHIAHRFRADLMDRFADEGGMDTSMYAEDTVEREANALGGHGPSAQSSKNAADNRNWAETYDRMLAQGTPKTEERVCVCLCLFV